MSSSEAWVTHKISQSIQFKNRHNSQHYRTHVLSTVLCHMYEYSVYARNPIHCIREYDLSISSHIYKSTDTSSQLYYS